MSPASLAWRLRPAIDASRPLPGIGPSCGWNSWRPMEDRDSASIVWHETNWASGRKGTGVRGCAGHRACARRRPVSSHCGCRLRPARHVSGACERGRIPLSPLVADGKGAPHWRRDVTARQTVRSFARAPPLLAHPLASSDRVTFVLQYGHVLPHHGRRMVACLRFSRSSCARTYPSATVRDVCH